MAQSEGISAQVGYQKEASFRVVPAVPALNTLYLENEGFNSSFNLITSNIIRSGGNPVMPSRGNQDSSFSFKTSLAPELAPLINLGVLGDNTTTGASPYTHTAILGTKTSFMFEKGMTDNNLYMIFNGCKFNSLELDFPNEGPIGATFGGLACCESMILPYDAQSGNFTVGNILTGGTSNATAIIVSDLDAGATGILIVTGIQGTFQNNETITDGATGSATSDIANGLGYASLDASFTDPGHTPWDSFEVTLIQEGGSGALLNVRNMNIRIENDIDGDTFVIGGKGLRGSLPVARSKVTGSITALFDSQAIAIYRKAMNFTETSLKVKAQHGSGAGSAGNEYFEILMSEIKWGKETPKITGPKGIVVDLPFEAYYDDGAETSAVQVVIKNPASAL